MRLGRTPLFAALALGLLLALSAPAQALEAEALVPGGTAVGIEMETDGVTVVGLTGVETEAGVLRPAEAAGLREGDVIRGIDGVRVDSAAELLAALDAPEAGARSLSVEREGRELNLSVRPARNLEGAMQLGIWLRDGVSGIGTLTFYDPVSGAFGALGHGISDGASGELLEFDRGCITGAEVVDVIRGAPGAPGELCGRFDRDAVLGSLEKNTDRGIFGISALPAEGTPLPVAAEAEVRLGPAVIRCSVNGTEVREYAVEISRIYRDTEDSRFLLLTVTDPALVEAAGGIVQGMSGSPIVQNGKLVGAVTHVLLNDPLRGYGISIEKMLEAA